jgi:hypothetical protein
MQSIFFTEDHIQLLLRIYRRIQVTSQKSYHNSLGQGLKVKNIIAKCHYVTRQVDKLVHGLRSCLDNLIKSSNER